MDSFRSISVVSVTQLLLAGAMSPALSEANDDDHRRHHARGQSHTVSHDREDYPVIFHWLTTPEAQDVFSPTAR
jgi:hypothetical protein